MFHSSKHSVYPQMFHDLSNFTLFDTTVLRSHNAQFFSTIYFYNKWVTKVLAKKRLSGMLGLSVARDRSQTYNNLLQYVPVVSDIGYRHTIIYYTTVPVVSPSKLLH